MPDSPSPEPAANESDRGRGCSCVDIFLHMALLAGIVPGVIAGDRFVHRFRGGWGLRIAGWIGGGLAGAVTGIVLAGIMVATVGLVAFAAASIQEHGAARKAARAPEEQEEAQPTDP